MELRDQISLCSQNYQKWKGLAFSTQNKEESRKFLDKAFFWIELQTAFIVLLAAEQTKGNDPAFKKKLMIAKASLLKRLSNYAEKILNEIQ